MIVLFIESDLIRQQELPERTCPHCGKAGHMVMDFRQRYAEFGTGKVYPKGVFGVVHCLKCGFTLPASRWDEPLHRVYNGLKAGYKTPISYWKGAIRTAVGLVVGVVLLVGVLSFMGQSQRAVFADRDARFSQVLTHPTPGTTLVVVSNNNTGMEVWRINRVTGETVWLNKYTGDRKLTNPYDETGWTTLPDSDFSGDAVGYSARVFAEKGLKRTEDVADKNKPYTGLVFSMLAN